ncbi:MAG: FAD-binding protein [Nitrososphaeria archaeon]|nr:FAD-binding protein [Nitrososphaeria archaeon]NIQ32380.1 FAD-binding protein [Nitrososphaeria archaeon]
MSHELLSEIKNITGPENIYEIPYDPIMRRGIYITTEAPDISETARPKVVLVDSAQQISRILKLVNERREPIVVRQGTGCLSVDVPKPFKPESILVDLRRMNWIRPYPESCYVEVGPAISLSKLNAHLAPLGYEYPISVDPITLGGLVSINISGHLVDPGYGKPGDYVLGLEVVLPTGEIINTGTKTLRRHVGFDLTRLFIGGQALFGVITNIRLRLVPKPAEKAYALVTFGTIDDIMKAVNRFYVEKKPYARILEFTDENYVKFSLLGRIVPRGSLLMIGTDGDAPGEARWKLDNLLETCKEENAKDVKIVEDEREWGKIWEARASPWIMFEERGLQNLGSEVLDIPLPRLQEAARDLAEMMERYIQRYKDLVGFLYGHIGALSFHPNFVCPIDWSYERCVEVMRRIREDVINIKLKYEAGTGDQGIFPEHKEWFRKAYGETYYKLVKKIKKVFDPYGILNTERI